MGTDKCNADSNTAMDKHPNWGELKYSWLSCYQESGDKFWLYYAFRVSRWNTVTACARINRGPHRAFTKISLGNTH